MVKLLLIYRKVKEVYDDLEYLVEPVVVKDIREQRGKLQEVLKLLEEYDTKDL